MPGNIPAPSTLKDCAVALATALKENSAGLGTALAKELAALAKHPELEMLIAPAASAALGYASAYASAVPVADVVNQALTAAEPVLNLFGAKLPAGAVQDVLCRVARNVPPLPNLFNEPPRAPLVSLPSLPVGDLLALFKKK